MKELEERIQKEGIILPGDVLKVGSFINQKVDTKLLKNMAKEVKRLFPEAITKVLTIEASGLPFATAIGMEYEVPVVFAKKSKTSNVSGELITAEVESYTHHEKNTIYITKGYIAKGDKVLIADDFLAKGNALAGLIEIVNKCEGSIVGAAIEIEKCYQDGGNRFRAQGYRIESLAMIEEMNENKIIFKDGGIKG